MRHVSGDDCMAFRGALQGSPPAEGVAENGRAYSSSPDGCSVGETSPSYLLRPYDRQCSPFLLRECCWYLLLKVKTGNQGGAAYFGYGRFLHLPAKAPTPGFDLGDSGPFVLRVMQSHTHKLNHSLRTAGKSPTDLASARQSRTADEGESLVRQWPLRTGGSPPACHPLVHCLFCS